MANHELREWLGLTLADLLVYLSIAPVVAMFFVEASALDIALGIVGVVLAFAACPFGMKRDPGVSDFTNALKLISYPVCVALVVGAIIVHYVWFAG